MIDIQNIKLCSLNLENKYFYLTVDILFKEIVSIRGIEIDFDEEDDFVRVKIPEATNISIENQTLEAMEENLFSFFLRNKKIFLDFYKKLKNPENSYLRLSIEK